MTTQIPPWIRQDWDASDCGPIVVAECASAFGIARDLDRLRASMLGTFGKGGSLASLRTELNAAGLDVRDTVWKLPGLVTADDLLVMLGLGRLVVCIVHSPRPIGSASTGDASHFLIVYGVSGQVVQVLDSLLGFRAYYLDAFISDWLYPVPDRLNQTPLVSVGPGVQMPDPIIPAIDLSTIDLSKLLPAPDGRQSDPGVTCADFEIAGVLPLVLVRRKGHPEEGIFGCSLVDLAAGKLSVHPNFLVVGKSPENGQWYIADREDVEARAVQLVNEVGSNLLGQAVSWLEGQIATVESGAPKLVAGFLAKLLGI